ncbi:MAG TPA: hypothetical protein VI338_05470 [Nitrososphaera sp.]|nr:hypothetical protein [Nitrososphaera sp.]
MRLVYLVAIAGGIIAATMIAIVASAIPTKDYDLSVDAMKDEQSLFTNARVVLKNTGKLPLTNVLVDYGNEKEPPIAVLQPGESLTMSPPEGVLLDSVKVTADPNISILQKYRTPIKLPGMIGS